MKTHLLFVILLITSAPIFGQAQKTYVKSIHQKSMTVVLDLQGDIIVKEWSESFIRIHIRVRLANGSEEVLKALMLSGRYRIHYSKDDFELSIFSSTRSTEITYKGKPLEEVISYQIFAPRHSVVKEMNPRKN